MSRCPISNDLEYLEWILYDSVFWNACVFSCILCFQPIFSILVNFPTKAENFEAISLGTGLLRIYKFRDGSNPILIAPDV